jgi:hypothetical protein
MNISFFFINLQSMNAKSFYDRDDFDQQFQHNLPSFVAVLIMSPLTSFLLPGMVRKPDLQGELLLYDFCVMEICRTSTVPASIIHSNLKTLIMTLNSQSMPSTLTVHQSHFVRLTKYTWLALLPFRY